MSDPCGALGARSPLCVQFCSRFVQSLDPEANFLLLEGSSLFEQTMKGWEELIPPAHPACPSLSPRGRLCSCPASTQTSPALSPAKDWLDENQPIGTAAGFSILPGKSVLRSVFSSSRFELKAEPWEVINDVGNHGLIK